MEHPFTKADEEIFEGWEQSDSGLAAVWATENTRASIFGAMERREVDGTTGTRIGVRFFGGWNYIDDDLKSRQPAVRGYEKGVPMGGDLPARTGDGAPTFMVCALRDPVGANLDRIQIVKGWPDAEGQTHEKVHDVAWSGDRRPADDGTLPPVGNTVDIANANWTNTIGASELATVWTDPDFDPAQHAFYYARVLEIPPPADRLQTVSVRRGDPRGRPHLGAGTRLHHAHLVHAGGVGRTVKKELLREPLLHFLVQGAALFLVQAWASDDAPEAGEGQVVVSAGRCAWVSSRRTR